MRNSIQFAISLPHDASLQPIMASQYDRFGEESWQNGDSNKRSEVIGPSSCVRTSGTAPEWVHSSQLLTGQKLVHPEGGIAYSHGNVVSNRQISVDIQDTGEQITARCSHIGLHDATVFLSQKALGIEYYVADHSSESLVWINGQFPSALASFAKVRTENTLREEYWAHMESFPGARPVSRSTIIKLKSVLSSLAIGTDFRPSSAIPHPITPDSATSEGSTSPFSYEQIRKFLRLLESFSGTDIDEHQTYAVARLWNMIWHARTINNFASSTACLDRLTAITSATPVFTGPNRLLAMAMLGKAEIHLLRCSRAWAGRVAYVSEWRQFKSKNQNEWNQVVERSCVVLVASLLMHSLNNFGAVNAVPTLMSLSAAAYGHHLLVESQNLGEHAADASNYFQLWEKPEYDTQRIALRNSIPQALLTWACAALLYLALQALVL